MSSAWSLFPFLDNFPVRFNGIDILLLSTHVEMHPLSATGMALDMTPEYEPMRRT